MLVFMAMIREVRRSASALAAVVAGLAIAAAAKAAT